MLCTALPLLSAIFLYEEHSLWGTKDTTVTREHLWGANCKATILYRPEFQCNHCIESTCITRWPIIIWLLEYDTTLLTLTVGPLTKCVARVLQWWVWSCCIWAQLIKSPTTRCSRTEVSQWMSHEALLVALCAFSMHLDWRKMIIGLMYSMLLSWIVWC